MASGRTLGEVFVALGAVSDEELEAALAAQDANGGHLGEILVEQGRISRFELAEAFDAEYPRRGATASRRTVGSGAAGGSGEQRADDVMPGIERALASLGEQLTRLVLELRSDMAALEAKVDAYAGPRGRRSRGGRRDGAPARQS